LEEKKNDLRTRLVHTRPEFWACTAVRKYVMRSMRAAMMVSKTCARRVENTLARVIRYLCVRPTNVFVPTQSPAVSLVGHEKKPFFPLFLFFLSFSCSRLSRRWHVTADGVTCNTDLYIYNYTLRLIIYRSSIIASCQNWIRTHREKKKRNRSKESHFVRTSTVYIVVDSVPPAKDLRD